MEFTILSPDQKKVFNIAWIEVNTPLGNFVIQRGHAPTILLVSPKEPLIICLSNGKQETFTTEGGILEITRQKATLIVNE